MAQQVSVTRAIAKAKRNIENEKYSRMENVLDALYQYYIQPEEVEIVINSINKWLAKNPYIRCKPFDEFDIERLKN